MEKPDRAILEGSYTVAWYDAYIDERKPWNFSAEQKQRQRQRGQKQYLSNAATHTFITMPYTLHISR